MWTFLRCSLLFFTTLLAAGVLAISIHIQVSRWPIQEFGLQLDDFNTTSFGSYDPSNQTINPTGLLVARILNYVGIIVGSATVFIGSASFICGLLKHASYFTTVFFELLWTFLLSTCWLATALVDAMGTTYPVIDICTGHSFCIELQVLRLMSFVNWLLFTGYFMSLLTFAAIGVARGKKAFTANTVTHDFYSRRHRTNGNPRGSLVSERPHSQTGTDSVYSRDPISPIQVHLNMSSSMSRDAQLVTDNWHEMKAVPSIESPQPRMYAKQFSLGSDDGEITDVALDDKEEVKKKPLV